MKRFVRYVFIFYRWWKADKCQTHEETTHYADDTEELKLENVAGIFFILAAGLILGLIACLIDKYTSLFKGKKKVSDLDK